MISIVIIVFFTDLLFQMPCQQLHEGKIRVTHWELLSFLFDQSKVLLDDILLDV